MIGLLQSALNAALFHRLIGVNGVVCLMSTAKGQGGNLRVC